MTWTPVIIGFSLGFICACVSIMVMRLTVAWLWKRKGRTRGYMIDTYESEPLTPVKKR